MSRRMQDFHNIAVIFAEGNGIAVPQPVHIPDDDVRSAEMGQIQHGVCEVRLSIPVDIHGNPQFPADSVNSARMVKMPVCQQNFLNHPAATPNQVRQRLSLRTGIDQESMPCPLINSKITVDGKVSLHLYSVNHVWSEIRHPSGPQDIPPAGAASSSSAAFLRTRSSSLTGIAPGTA